MTTMQGTVIFLFFTAVILSIIWVITGYNPFKKKPSPFPPPRYLIDIDGYDRFRVRYNPAPEWGPSGYVVLPKTFNTIEEAENNIKQHKDWIIKRKFKIIKEID